MATRKIETEISLTGEKAFNDGMKAINSNLKTLKSDMSLVSAEFKTNANSVEALRAKQSVLQQQYDQQKEKVSALKEHLAKVTQAYGENSAQADKYRQQLNTATAQQIDFEQKLNATTEALKKATNPFSGLSSAIADLTKEDVHKLLHPLEGVKDALKNMTAEDLKAGLSNLKGKIGDLWDSVKGVPLDLLKDSAKALYDMGKAAVEQTVQSAAYADNILTMATNTGLSTDALQEYQYMAELTDTSVDTITGSLKKLTNNMDNARNGSKTASEAFEKLGVAVTNEDGSLRNNQEVFADVIDKLGKMENATERDAVSMDIFGKSAQDLNSLIAVGGDGIRAFADEAHRAGAVMDGDTLTALGAVDDAMQRFQSTAAAAKNAIGAEFAEPVETIMNGLTAVMQGDIDGGMQMIIDGIDQASGILDELLPMAEEMLTTLLDKFVEYAPKLLTTGIDLITKLILGISQTLPQIIPKMVEAIVTMVQTLTSPDNLGQLMAAGIDLMVELALALVKGIPEIIPAMIQALETIVTTLWDNREKIVEAGKDLIRGIWDGITAMGQWLKDKISGWASGIINSFKKAFGISSPSRLMRDDVGKWMARGLGEGFTNEMAAVNREMQNSINTRFELSPDVRLRGTGGGQSAAPSREELQSLLSGFVNGVQTAVTGPQTPGGTLTVNLTLPDGSTILRYFIDLARANGTPITA